MEQNDPLQGHSMGQKWELFCDVYCIITHMWLCYPRIHNLSSVAILISLDLLAELFKLSVYVRTTENGKNYSGQ